MDIRIDLYNLLEKVEIIEENLGEDMDITVEVSKQNKVDEIKMIFNIKGY